MLIIWASWPATIDEALSVYALLLVVGFVFKQRFVIQGDDLLPDLVLLSECLEVHVVGETWVDETLLVANRVVGLVIDIVDLALEIILVVIYVVLGDDAHHWSVHVHGGGRKERKEGRDRGRKQTRPAGGSGAYCLSGGSED